jgi:hypothetical protein
VGKWVNEESGIACGKRRVGQAGACGDVVVEAREQSAEI